MPNHETNPAHCLLKASSGTGNGNRFSHLSLVRSSYGASESKSTLRFPEVEWVCDKFVGRGPLAGSPRFPEVFPLVAQIQAAQGDNGVGTSHRPAHARLFEPLTDDHLATGFHHTRADK